MSTRRFFAPRTALPTARRRPWPTAPYRWRLLVAVGATAALTLSACGEGIDEGEDDIESRSYGLSVGSAGGCSTAIVAGLSKQLIEEQNCMRPGSLVDFRGTGISVASNVWPYLEAQPAAALHAAVRGTGRTIHITSAFRTLAQQYLLYKWQGSCGIQVAASPGRSNHETGIAIDVSDHASWQSRLQAHGFRWFGSGDVVHFDYTGGGTRDLRGDSVKAFQRLWNRNHPHDQIAVDGIYGPQTESRLRQSPAGGFAHHGCGTNTVNATLPDMGAEALDNAETENEPEAADPATDPSPSQAADPTSDPNGAAADPTDPTAGQPPASSPTLPSVPSSTAGGCTQAPSSRPTADAALTVGALLALGLFTRPLRRRRRR